MTRMILLLLTLGIGATAHADVSDSGNLTIGGQGIIQGTMTVQGAAFSVGGSSFAVSAGTVQVGGLLRVSSQGIQWNDGSVSTTSVGGVGGASSSTYVRLCGGDQTPTGTQNTQATAATVTNSTATMTFASGSWAEVAVTLFHYADGTQYNVDLYVDNARPSWVGTNGLMTCQGTASSIIGTCTGVFPISVTAGPHTFYLKVWRGGNPVTLKMANPCSYYTVKEMRAS